MTLSADVLIVGGGIAGVSLAARLAPSRSVVLVEAEEHLGTHATGRSASMLIGAYGPPVIRRLTGASRGFFESPPAGFAAAPLARPRACLVYAGPEDDPALLRREFLAASDGGEPVWLDRDGVLAACPILRPERVAAGFIDRNPLDLDTDALLQAFARAAERSGARILRGAGLSAIARAAGGWQAAAAGETIFCGIVANAAGAWADRVAALAGLPPLGLEPRRRTAATLPLPGDVSERAESLPMVMPVDESFYFKPDAGAMLVSLSEETPAQPGDVYADDLDVALALERFHEATTVPRARPRAAWAGLRTFAPDRRPVVGFDARDPAFFWHAGLGGYGIQTSPALASLSAGLIAGAALDEPEREMAEAMAPARFRPVPA